jgi:hypothetical protein
VRALRFVYNDYSSSSETLLENAMVPTLQVRRIKTMALETYKYLHNLAPVCLQNLLHTKNSKYYFRYRNILDAPQVRTTTYDKRSFRFVAASQWNSLPDHFRTENSFAHFRSLVQSWTGSDCRCSACK